ncbi:hypothetical protein NQ317_003918 [Molorchus minor]|uniref:Globin domain-containing protein n=1 Tax=Molorchus minor TaxID=1323400 RepID=A0ABQ9J7S3_9CUCU|nr:hypothetical protein NQ317_003918 [Molorchus minor]
MLELLSWSTGNKLIFPSMDFALQRGCRGGRNCVAVAQFVIFDEKPVYPDLISGSKHLLQSEFVRSFISSVATLMYLGNTRQFTSVEFTTPTYVPNTADDPWRPWHHVYSNCKLGKGKDHAPVVNRIGKYIVRLFWLGAWRKIYVDDLLPVDMLNHVLLPSLELTKEEQEKLMPQEETPPPTPATVDSGKKSKASDKKKPPPPKVIEVWPFLLSKALLKIASLSWYDDRELLDFDIVQCLTGWVPQKIDTKDLTIDDIWELCSAYTDHFCWPPDKSEASKSTKSTKGSKKGKKGKAALDDLDSAANAHHLMARCDDMRNFAEDEILDVSPCWGHYFLIDQTRNIPLIKPTLTADLPFWKRFRWLSWAVEKGLISPEENMDQIRCFKFVSLFKKVYEHVVYKQPSKMAIEIEETVNAIEDLVKDKKGKEKGGKGKGKDKKSDKSSKSSKSSKAKSSKSSKGSKKKKFDPSLIPNPSIWLDYEKLAHQITTLTIYFKPSKFKSKIKITDLTPAAAGGKGGKGGGSPRKGKGGDPSAEWQTFISPRIIKVSRNEPVYVFTDSVDYKLLDTSDHPESTGITECEFCVAALVKRIRRNITKSDRRTFITLTPDEPEPVDHERPRAHFVLETFDWRKETLGDMVTSLCTFANKTTVVDLCPGRHIFRLWVKSDTPYVLYLLSDTSVVSGTLEAVLFSLSQESQLLMNACIEVASNFGKLVQSFGMPEFPLQLRAFYSSYKPSCFLTKPESNTVHDTFYSLLYDLVKQNAMADSRDVINLVGPMCFCNCYDDEEDFEYVKVMQRYVVRVQYFFIGIYERAMMKYHKPEHKNYMKTFDALKNIYNQFFQLIRD